MKKKVTGYVCLTTFEYDMEGDSAGTTIYPTVKNLKDATICWKQCGYAKVSVKIERVMKKGNMP